jgi:hypothetical protein
MMKMTIIIINDCICCINLLVSGTQWWTMAGREVPCRLSHFLRKNVIGIAVFLNQKNGIGIAVSLNLFSLFLAFTDQSYNTSTMFLVPSPNADIPAGRVFLAVYHRLSFM